MIEKTIQGTIGRFALAPLAAGLLVLAAAPAAAQDKLAEGVWTGTVYPPGEELVVVEYEVSYVDGALTIDLVPPPEMGMGAVPAESPTFIEGVLSFTLNVGETVGCSLFRNDDGSLEGECIDSTGGAAIMTMVPPEG